MAEVTIVGVDIAKNVFHLHGAASDGSVVFRKKLTRMQFQRFMASQPTCVVAMEACGGAHHWAREMKLQGHEPRLIAPGYVRPFVKRQKMGWLPPSPDGIAMCQGRGVQRHEKERTANEGYNDRCGFGKERLPASRRQLGRALEVSQEGDAGSVSAFHGEARTCRRGDGGLWQRELLGAGDGQAWP